VSNNTVVAELVAAAGIERVVVVDDAYSATVEDLIEILAGFSAVQRADVVGLEESELTEDGVWQERVRKRWAEAEQDGQVAMVDNAYSHDQKLQPMDSGAVETLRQLLPDIAFQGFTLADWKKSRAEVLEAMQTRPALVLFDQDFRREEGGDEKTGQRLLSELEAELKGRAVADDVYYGILTNTVRPDEEHERRLEIVAEAEVDPRRLVLISKQHLQGDPATFAARLRTTLLAPIMTQLMTEASDAVSTAHQAALKKAGQIAPEDMERMVVRGSGTEGIWEPDTLVRILEIMQRTKVRDVLRREKRVVKLTKRLRTLADIDPLQTVDQAGEEDGERDNQSGGESPGGENEVETGEATASGRERGRSEVLQPSSTSARRDEQSKRAPAPVAVGLQHDEIYDSAEHINTLHLPLELGDLFAKEGSKKRYALIVQPCDISVRKGGKRAPELSHFLLAEVVDAGEKDLFESFELPYFDRTEASAFVRLSRPVFTLTLVLDACVLNGDGKARIDVKQESPDALLPHWRDRHVAIKAAAQEILQHLGEQEKPTMKFRKAISGHVTRDPFAPAQLDATAGVIEWNCQRVGRICDPYARALLSRFSQYFARDAYLLDLARL
jgi:hypothetical protein